MTTPTTTTQFAIRTRAVDPRDGEPAWYVSGTWAVQIGELARAMRWTTRADARRALRELPLDIRRWQVVEVDAQ